MEPYYYSKMNKVQQTAYHAIRQGLLEISDSIQIPGMEAEELYNVFFRLRLDHPEIFWATGYKYKYYPDSPNSIFIPEYLFDKNKIKEHQKAYVMLQELLEQEQFELIFPEQSISGQPDIRLVYLMNDAVESFLVFHNARMTGEYRPDYEGEISASMSFEDTEYILVVHQGDSVVTIFFEDLLTDVHLYDYGEIGHFWKKNYEYLRQLEYRLAIMRDKYDYLGEEYCTLEEQKLAMLVDFPPLNYCCYPAVPEQYIVPRVEPWVPTEEAIAVMEELAAESDDKGLLKILKNYRKHPKPYIAKKIAAMLHRNAHAKVVDLLDEKLRKTVSVYEKRSFGKEMDVRCQQLMHKVEERRQQLQKEGKASVILREEPFEIAKDSIAYQIHLMIWEKGILNRKVKIESYSLEK